MRLLTTLKYTIMKNLRIKLEENILLGSVGGGILSIEYKGEVIVSGDTLSREITIFDVSRRKEMPVKVGSLTKQLSLKDSDRISITVVKNERLTIDVYSEGSDIPKETYYVRGLSEDCILHWNEARYIKSLQTRKSGIVVFYYA